MRITATDTLTNRVLARFDSTDDAMVFAEAVTSGSDRSVTLSDIAGWVMLTYRNGMTTDL